MLLRRGAYVNRVEKLDDRTIFLSGQTGDDGVRYMAVCRAVGEGVTVVGNTLLVPEKCDLFLAAATSFRAEELMQACLRHLEAAERAGYEGVRDAHIEDMRALMDRCTLTLERDVALDALPTDQRLARYALGQLNNGLEAGYFAFGRYLLAGCSRPGEPAGQPAGRVE